MISFSHPVELVDYSTCQPGQYESISPTASNDRLCSTCPSGQACSGSAITVDCGSTSLFAAGGASTCTPVSTGYYSTPADGSTGQRTGQAICPAGNQCHDGVATACVSGSSYQTQTGQTSCIPCPTCATGLILTSVCTSTAATVCQGM